MGSPRPWPARLPSGFSICSPTRIGTRSSPGRERVRLMVEASPAGGVLALDDTAFPKQGKHSVGVARQYCGELGKGANCQAVVTAEYVAGDLTSPAPMHWPVSARLFLPDEWAGDGQRRRRAHVPTEIQKQSKPEIALELIDRATAWGVPFRLVTADAAYGHFRDFFEGLEERKLLYACAVKSNFGVRRPEEVQVAEVAPPPPRKGVHGRKTKRHPAPLCRTDEVIAKLPAEAWQAVTWREGSRGPMQKEFAALRMHWGKGCAARSLDDHRTATSAEGWLIGERPLAKSSTADGETKYYFSNLSAETTLEELAVAVRARWPIEQFYEDGKQLCGLGDYQGRRWDGLHRHVALVMLSYSFLTLTRWQAKSDSTALPTLPEVHRQVLLALLTDLVQRWALVEKDLRLGSFASLLDRAPPDPFLTK